MNERTSSHTLRYSPLRYCTASMHPLHHQWSSAGPDSRFRFQNKVILSQLLSRTHFKLLHFTCLICRKLLRSVELDLDWVSSWSLSGHSLSNPSSSISSTASSKARIFLRTCCVRPLFTGSTSSSEEEWSIKIETGGSGWPLQSDIVLVLELQWRRHWDLWSAGAESKKTTDQWRVFPCNIAWLATYPLSSTYQEWEPVVAAKTNWLGTLGVILLLLQVNPCGEDYLTLSRFISCGGESL